MKGGIKYGQTQTQTRPSWPPLLPIVSRWYSFMMCVNPRRLPNPNATGVHDAYIRISCGKCYACLANRRRSWLFRLQNESLDSQMSLFVTLTYEDENCDGWLHKDHVQKFFKRLRRKGLSFRYYSIGEYGTTTMRPHYHVVLFIKNLPLGRCLDDYAWLIRDCWPAGFVQVSRAHYRRLNYVLHYHTRPKVVNGRPTFCLFSKGLGVSFLNGEYLRWLMQTDSSVLHDWNGSTYVVPRYYRKKIKDMIVSTPKGLFQFSDKEFSMSLHDDDDNFFRVHGRHLYEVSEKVLLSYSDDVRKKDTYKLKNYNKQDKFV